MLALAPTQQGDDMRERIGDALQGIIAQRLLPKKDGNGLVLAAEVLVATGTVREAIKRPNNNPPIKELMEKGDPPVRHADLRDAPEAAGDQRGPRQGRRSRRCWILTGSLAAICLFLAENLLKSCARETET